MEPIFRTFYTLTDLHVDRYDKLKLSTLLFFAQEAAGTHCLSLEADYDTLASRHLAWVITRNRVQITRLPQKGETITLETWPMPTTKVAYPRSTVAYDESGREVFRAIALWALMDTENRKLVLPAKSGLTFQGTLRGGELALPGGLMPRTMVDACSRQVCYTDLDRNGHMNNTRYMDWVQDLLPSAFYKDHEPRDLTLCYMTEAREGQQLELSFELSDGPVLQAEAVRQEDPPARIFSAKIQF